jgi:flagellar basal-body rod modification protein FlgD
MAVAATPTASEAASALFESLNGTKKAQASDSVEFAQNRFLMLLTTQLKNQDPLNPMDNAQMTSQLAQISTVDGIERLNSTLSKLIDGQSENQTLQAAALVGHGVMVAGSEMMVSNSYGLGGYELASPADRVSVEIKDANGLVVRTLKFDEGQDAGVQMFSWDGKTDSGEQAADGAYSITVAATLGNEKVTAERLQLGFVDSVARTSRGLDISVGKLGKFGMADIKQIL